MEKDPIEKFSSEDRERFGVIENRPDLFETKVLRISPETPGSPEKTMHKILVASRDPGSANALVPVMRQLLEKNDIEMMVLTDGRAQEAFYNNFPCQDITPSGMALEADNVIGTPDLILTDSSDERGLETYAAATFGGVPTVAIEDYYFNSHPYLEALLERNLPLPERICVMDKAAKRLILEKFPPATYPQISERIVITGQPAFDRFAKEPTEQIHRDVRTELGIKDSEQLISMMTTFTNQGDVPPRTRQAVEKMADQIQGLGGNVVFAFRPHPRIDQTPYEQYEKIFRERGVRIIDSRQYSSDQINAASDIVMTTWSTEGLNGIYRRKPTIHITDDEWQPVPDVLTLPLPPVKVGASIGLTKLSNLGPVIQELSNPDSQLSNDLRQRMDQFYPVDGKNTERVLNEVQNVMTSRQSHD
jgi:hypothetical protein